MHLFKCFFNAPVKSLLILGVGQQLSLVLVENLVEARCERSAIGRPQRVSRLEKKRVCLDP